MPVGRQELTQLCVYTNQTTTKGGVRDRSRRESRNHRRRGTPWNMSSMEARHGVGLAGRQQRGRMFRAMRCNGPNMVSSETATPKHRTRKCTSEGSCAQPLGHMLMQREGVSDWMHHQTAGSSGRGRSGTALVDGADELLVAWIDAKAPPCGVVAQGAGEDRVRGKT